MRAPSLTPIQLANIEALTSDEDLKMARYKDIVYTGSGMDLYCETYSYRWGYRGSGSQSRCK